MAFIRSTVQVLYDGTTDITRDVRAAQSSFELLINASPGSCEVHVRDRARTHDFVTGKELVLKVDGQTLWGGFLTSVTRKYALPVVDTSDISKVDQRVWVLRGVDYNTLFNKRVLRNPLDYLHQLPNFPRGTMDGALIREALTASKYFDIEPEFDVTSEVDDVTAPFDPLNEGTAGDGAWLQQGSTMRAFFEDLAQFSGAVYYIGPDKKFHYKALEDVEARWGFSDDPNNAAITSAPGYQNATIGFREIDAVEAGGPSTMVNDALIWGGSEWSGSGQTVFARKQDAASQAEHGRWQVAETHFGEEGYKLQSGVDARANVIVHGNPGAVGGDANRGLRFSQWTISLKWMAHSVPRIAAAPDHLKAGDIVRISLSTFGESGTALEHILPLRRLRISFLALKEPASEPYDPADDEIASVQLEGTFGLQLNDPYTLWRFLLERSGQRIARVVSTVDGSDPAPYGSIFSGAPVETPDGVITVFNLPDNRGYIAGTTEVYVDGARVRRGTDYTESDPNNGEITFTSPVSAADWVWIVCRTI